MEMGLSVQTILQLLYDDEYGYLFFSVVKEAIRSSGANATEKHIEDVSVCALLLMEAAKKADQAFGVTPKSGAHTVRSAENDIQKMVEYLMLKKATLQVLSRSESASPFTDPTEKGWEKLSTTDWIRETVARSHSEDMEAASPNDELDSNYEIYDVT